MLATEYGKDAVGAMVTNKPIGTLIAMSVDKPPRPTRTRAEGNTSVNLRVQYSMLFTLANDF